MGLSCIKNKSYHFSLLLRLISFLLILNGLSTFISPVIAASKVHIIYMGERRHHDPDRVTESHHEMLASVLGSKEAAADSMIYSYRHGFSGFAAKLSESQAQEFKGLPGVLHVMPNHFYSLKTTRSWDYLGQSLTSSNNLLHQANMGDGIIVGVIDSGVWPESKGLNDEGLGPIPMRWKGSCKSGDGFDAKIHCNKKLIGAKWFADALLAENKDQFNTTGFREFLSVRDVIGHGTHTATTAAGSMVRNANFKGFMRGMARGGAPHARIAVYKACWNVPNLVPDCNAADMLKAFDEAIHDGVDLLSISIGDHVPLRSDVDFRGLNVGSFHAVAKGIPVICAGGNDGPGSQTVANTPPWLLTVAASSMDRLFPTRIMLGNNMTIHGESFYNGKEIGFTSLVHPESPKGIIREPRSYCDELSFEDVTVKGKVVLCFSHGSYAQAVSDVKDAGGVGLIVAQNPNSNLSPSNADDDDFPSVLVDYELGTQILFYIRTFRSPVVKIGRAKTLIGDPVATMIAAFSSRGPSSLTPAILKPDIAAPGVNIIAGGSASSSIDGFAIFTGTSMACPHVSGIVALLKAIHPHWSPAAIKSAIVTTATKTDPFGEPIFAEEDPRKLATPFDYGGGLVNPKKAANPGLVYDMSIHDYILYLCSQSYDSSSISLLVGLKTSCPLTKPSVLDVNLPSITIPNLKNTVSVTRTVTNVGPVNSKYRVRVDPPVGVSVTVTPNMLVFSESVKSVSFKVTFSTTHQVNNGYYFGSLVWSDGIHVVSIPLSVRTQIIEYLAEY